MTEYVSKDDFFINMCKQIKNPSIKSWIGAIISEIPAADVAPVKHGKWTPFVNVCGRLEGWLHTACGRQTNEMSNYCPNCGAKMDWEV